MCVQGIRESIVLPASSDQSRASFQDSDGQGIWKEIHTDTPSTPSTPEHSSHSHNILTPSVSATSLDQQHSGPFPKPSSSSPARPAYMEAPALLMSPCSEGMLPAGRIAGSNYFISVPNTPGQRNYNIPGRHASPRTAMAHSPQNINILSPQLRPLEKSPKLTQLHIASPRIPEMTALSPEQQLARPAYDLSNDARILPTSMLPPASVDPRQAMPLSSPVHAGKLSNSTVRLKKLMKSRQAEQSPRASVSKDRSPGRIWKKSFRAVSPLSSIRSTEAARNTVRGLTRDINNSFQDSKARATAAAACVNSSNLPSWRGCADDGQAVVAPALDRDMSQGWIPQAFFCPPLFLAFARAFTFV